MLIYVAMFLIGLQATVFGPVKYSYLPQHLDASELTRGNGLIEMATFIAILLGTIVAGVLIDAFATTGAAVVAVAVVLLAIAGRAAAQFIPLSPAADASLRINWNPFSETWANLKTRAPRPHGVQLDPGNLLAMVFRIDLSDQPRAVRARSAGRQRSGCHVPARRVFDRHRRRFAVDRSLVGPQS